MCPAWAAFWRRIAAGLAAGGGLFTPNGSCHHFTPRNLKCSMFQLIVPSFWAGKLSIESDSMLTPAEAGASHVDHAFNLGELMGLRGLGSLLPLLAV